MSIKPLGFDPTLPGFVTADDGSGLTGVTTALAGDVTGTTAAAVVVGLQTKPINNTPPTNHQALEFLTSTNKWTAVSEAGFGYGPTYYLVGKPGSNAPYNSIQTAINQAIIDNGGVERTTTTPAVVVVLPGTYTENITLKKHVHVVAVNGGMSAFSTILAGTITCNLALEGGGKLSTFVYWDGVTVQGAPASPAIYFTGTNNQKLFLRNMNFGGSQDFLLLDNTGISAAGASQVECYKVKASVTSAANFGIRVKAGQLYFDGGELSNNQTTGGVTPVVVDVTSAAGNFPIYVQFTQSNILGRINVDSTLSTVTTPAGIFVTFALCNIQSTIAGTPSPALVAVKGNATTNATALSVLNCTFVPSTWSATNLAPIRGTGTTPVFILNRSNQWNCPVGALPTILCDNAIAVSFPIGVVDPSGVVPGTYPAPGQIATYTVDALGRLTAAGSTTNGSALTGVVPSYISARTVYADPISGNDANSGLSPFLPVQKFSRAKAVVDSLAPTAQTMVRLFLGAGQFPTEAGPLQLPQNCQIIGSGQNTSVLSNGLIFNPVSGTAINLDIQGIYCNNLTIDISAAPSATITIRDCQIPVSNLKSPNNGADQITVWNCVMESGCTVAGSIAFNDTYASTVTTQTGSGVAWYGGQIFQGLSVTGNSTTTLTGVDTFNSSGGTFAITGTLLGGFTPVIATDYSSIHGLASVTGPVNWVYLDNIANPKYELWVDYATTIPASQRIGSVALPFLTVQEAATYIATQPVGAAYEINVSPGSEPGTINFPPQQNIVINGAGKDATIWGNVTQTVDSATSTLRFKNLSFNAMSVVDGASPNSLLFASENCTQNGSFTQTGTSLIAFSATANQYAAFSTSFSNAFILGDIIINGYIYAENITFDVGCLNITSNNQQLRACSFVQATINNFGGPCEILECEWQYQYPKVLFFGVPNVLSLDAKSTDSWNRQLGYCQLSGTVHENYQSPNLFLGSDSIDRYYFGNHSLSQFFTDWASPSVNVSLLGPPPAAGDSFSGALGEARVSVNQRLGWITVQPATNALGVILGSRALVDSYMPLTNVAVELELSMSVGNPGTVVLGDAIDWIFSNTVAGDIDQNNLVIAGVGHTGINQWTISFSVTDNGTQTTIATDTITSASCPVRWISIENQLQNYRVYYSVDRQNWKQLGSYTSTSGTMNLNRETIFLVAQDQPNCIFGLGQTHRYEQMAV